MKHKLLYLLTLFLLLTSSCKEQKPMDNEAMVVEEKSNIDTFYQYNIWWAFVNKVFDGDLTVEKMKEYGDTGLGSFNMLDGEMVMIDGVAYQVREDGVITEGKDSDKIIYANAAFFEEESSINLTEVKDLESLKTELLQKLSSPNFFYVFKIHGTFKTMKCGGLAKQERPFDDGLDVLIPNRPVFEGENVTGTVVGFYCPDFIGNINAKGFHFHFISEDKKLGGHIMDFSFDDVLKVGIDKKTNYHFQLPDNDDFKNVGFDKEFQYKKDSIQ